MRPLTLYDYLISVRARVLTAATTLTDEQYRRDMQFGLGSIGSTLTHIMVSEWYYMERFGRRPVPHYSQWPIQYENPPRFHEIQRLWAEQQVQIRATIAAETNWERVVEWESFADDAGKRFHVQVTAVNLVLQLVTHEVHHRAQVMSMMKLLGSDVTPVEDVDYSAFAYRKIPIV